MLSLAFQRFPEVYSGGSAPAMFGAIDKKRQSGTPVYRYGWVISRAELYEALHGEPCSWDGLLTNIYIGAGRRLYALWTEKGYDDNEYNPDIPCVKEVSVNYVVIYMACNDSADIIKSVMENKKYHAECRACMGNPKTMEMEPAWFRVGLKDLPKGLSDTVTVGNVDQ